MKFCYKKMSFLLAITLLALPGCSRVENANSLSELKINMKKDVVVTFAAWTSEEVKLKKLKYEGGIKAIQKCGFKQKYKLIEIESYRWGGSEDTVNRIASNILCTNEPKKNILAENKIFSKNKQKIMKREISSDIQKPMISVSVKVEGSIAIISGTIIANTEVQEVLVGKLQLPTFAGGAFEVKEYIPRSGKTIEIVAYDRKGNKATKVLKIERGNIQQASGPKFDALNPLGKRVKSNPNSLALIIGVANYEKTPANALYADKDAQQFYDYATMKLGIPSSNIKELVNDKADLGEIGLAVQDWIARSTKKDKTDIYIFFAGHGLASDDGKNMYLLPYDGRPRLLDKTALLRDELFKEIQQANPRSVTVFLDTCYSGTTRGTDMLIASRPIFIAAKEQSIPNNFTVFSAAAGDQTSKPLEEAKHGMFSYFLMKGMEGYADVNNDNKITAQELHNYVKENVTQQSSGSQTPELQGDTDRVLVQFN
ncbi:caspase family protein [Alphaproteobacteria bacterium]|nr:caspase family protein [Alphaproteobacteria bacterium]